MAPSEQRDIAIKSCKKRLIEIEEDLKELSRTAELAQRMYNRQMTTAIKIVPELSTYVYVNPNTIIMDHEEPETVETVNFYNQFNSDLLMYKIVRWFSNGGKTCYTGRNDTFKMYPEIGVLTAINIKKLDALAFDEPTITDHFIDAHIRKLCMKIDVLFGLYNNEVTAETEAYKKLHKF